jgi:hypothetical protein
MVGETLGNAVGRYAADIDQEEKKWRGLVRKLGLRVE